MDCECKRVLYVTNLPAPYKVEYFNELGKYVELTVLYERSSARNRDKSWVSTDESRRYSEIYLSGIDIGDEMSLDLSVIKHIKANRGNFIILNGYSSPTEMVAIQYMKAHKIPFGLMCDGMVEKDDSVPLQRLKHSLISAASYWLSSSKETDKVLLHYGADENRIYRYPFSSIHKSEIAAVPYIKTDYKKNVGCASKYMLLYVGQMIPRKGIDILLQAISGISLDIQLFLVGGEVKVSDPRIINIGFSDKAALKNYYMAADLFILPSREDIWGLVINEAMAHGVPVIATNRCGAASEMINPGKTGYIVPSEDAGALQDAICNCLENLTAPDVMEDVVETAKKFTIEAMAKTTFDIICKL